MSNQAGSFPQGNYQPRYRPRKVFRQRWGRHHELTEDRTQGIVQAMPAIQDRAVIEATR
jgi:hypothetical protein